jgi:hydroxypyruvate reductase
MGQDRSDDDMRLSLQPITALEADLPDTAKEQTLAILRAALQAADPAEAIRRALVLRGNVLAVGTRSYDLRTCEHIYVVGAGKASAAMAFALEDMLGERITAGWINVKDGYTAPTRRITIHEAGHPLPDTRSVAGSAQIAALVRQAGEKDLVIALISGGGSALMTLPVEGITLSDMEQLTQALLRCGATINEMNAIRKHIEQLKGGQLVRLAHPARVIALILSDVIGSPLDVIASGPTSPDPTTFADAHAVLHKYGLLQNVPGSIVQHLRRGMANQEPETPKAQAAGVWPRAQNVVIASNEHAVQAAVVEAQRLGFNTLLLSAFVEGEAREVAKVLGAVAKEIVHSGRPVPRPACIVAGGETTVAVRGHGLGGRNQELALSAALSIAGLDNVAILSLGTDGTDGPTDAAGAIATGRTLTRAAEKGLQPLDSLADNDTYHFFQSLGDLVITGPTNTNVNDLMFVFAF